MWKPFVKSSFFSLFEIFLYLLTGLIILIILYPGERLKKELMSHKEINVDLAIVYGKTLFNVYKDPTLAVYLADRLASAGRLEELRGLIADLERKGYRLEANIASYALEKALYFRDVSYREKARENMENYLNQATQLSRDASIAEYIYRESISMFLPRVSQSSSYRLYLITGDPAWLKKAYSHAVEIGDYRAGFLYAKLLIVIDRKTNRNLVRNMYILAMNRGEIEDSMGMLVILIAEDTQYREVYINDMLYILHNSGRGMALLEKYKNRLNPQAYGRIEERLSTVTATKEEGLEYYLELYKRAQSYEEKKKSFLKVIQYMLWSGRYEELQSFLEKNYKTFTNDPEVVRHMLRSALASGNPHLAQKIALESKGVIE